MTPAATAPASTPASRILVRLVTAVVALLFSFYGFLAVRALTWTPRFFVSAGRPPAPRPATLPAPVAPWPARDAGTPEARGRELYYQAGCVACHGLEGRGGVRNANAKTHEEIPALLYVKDSYKEDWLVKKIEEGVARIDKLDPKRPDPPMRMPAWRGRFDDAELHDLAAYLFSLYPAGGAPGDE